MFLVHFVSFISLHTLGSDPFLLTAPILQNVKWLPCAFFIVFISLFASVPLSSLYTLPWASSLGNLHPHSRVLCHMLTPFSPPPASTRKRSQLFLCMRSSIGSRHRSLPFIVYLDAIISFNSISCFLLPSSLSPLPLSIIIWEKKDAHIAPSLFSVCGKIRAGFSINLCGSLRGRVHQGGLLVSSPPFLISTPSLSLSLALPLMTHTRADVNELTKLMTTAHHCKHSALFTAPKLKAARGCWKRWEVWGGWGWLQ